MRGAFGLFVALLALLSGCCAQFFTDRYDSSGAYVSAPRFDSLNLTWQFSVHMFAVPGTIIFPLFVNRSGGDVDTQCVGLVSVCCLWRLRDAYINTELEALLSHLDPSGSCGVALEVPASRDVLEELPELKSTALHAWPSYSGIRSWGVAESETGGGAQASEVTFEIFAEVLRLPWLTRTLDPAEIITVGEDDVTDRELVITFAYVQLLSVPFIQVVESRQAVVFHDATQDFERNTNTEHRSFLVLCDDRPKPADALWRADVADANGTCAWFCRPGFVRYPSSTDWWYETVGLGNGSCLAEPRWTAVLELGLYVLVQDASEATISAAVMATQRAVTLAASNVSEQSGMIYVQARQPGEPVAGSRNGLRLAVSVLVLTGRYAPNETVQLARAEADVQALINNVNAVNLNGDYRLLEHVQRMSLEDSRAFLRAPETIDPVPMGILVLCGTWAVGMVGLLTSMCCAFWKHRAAPRLRVVRARLQRRPFSRI